MRKAKLGPGGPGRSSGFRSESPVCLLTLGKGKRLGSPQGALAKVLEADAGLCRYRVSELLGEQGSAMDNEAQASRKTKTAQWLPHSTLHATPGLPHHQERELRPELESSVKQGLDLLLGDVCRVRGGEGPSVFPGSFGCVSERQGWVLKLRRMGPELWSSG